MRATKPFDSIIDVLKAFPTEEACIKYFERLRWENGVVSPYNAESVVYKCKGHKYKCKNTNKYFTVRTNSIFEGSKIPLQQWILAIFLFNNSKKGISSYQLARDLSITQKSAWFMLHRIRYAMEHSIFQKEMEGTIECDETFVGGKNKNRHKDKKVPQSQGRSYKDKTPVFGMLQRGGHVKCVVIPDTKARSIQPVVKRHVKKGSNLMTDEWHAYRGLGRLYNHKIVDHGRGQYVSEDCYTNNLENFWSHLKRGIIGVYHFTTKKHLQKYVNEFTFRYNTRLDSAQGRINLLLQTAFTKRISYLKLTNG